MNAQTMIVYTLSNTPELDSALHSHLDCDDENRQYYRSQPCQSSWKTSMIVKYHK